MTLPESVLGSVVTLWTEHDSQRLGWAFRAYERFVASLSPEIRERLAQKGQQEEAYVVVFGKTQVGKTTLLLDLMGVDPASLERVSMALRGGRAQGQSATATAMEYRRSADQRWGLQFADKATRWFDDDRCIRDDLGKVRAAMEGGKLVGDAPCLVYIPADCFALQAGQPVVRMLDLPGDKPANPTEQEHVQKMARKYVPLADLILLVGKGDDLSFLQPGGLVLPGIEDWQSVPGRFRIVTTFSFTARSVRNLVRQHEGPNEAGFYRQRLIEQIEKFGSLGDDARMPERYFPLEFGATWLDAKQRQPELYTRISPLIDALKRQLHADILASTTPMARLRNAVEARVVIARVKENHLRTMQGTTERIKRQLEQARQEHLQARNSAEQKRKKSKDLADRLAKLSDEQLRLDLEQHFKLVGTTPCTGAKKSVDGFKILVRQAKASLKQRLEDSRPNSVERTDTDLFWHNVKVEIDPQRVDEILSKAFSSFLTSLNGYVLDTYWFDDSDSDYMRDDRQLNRCINDASQELAQLARDAWLTAALRQRDRHRQDIRNLSYELLALEHTAANMASRIACLEQKLATHEQEDCKFRERMEKDLQESRRFTELLDTEYLTELQSRRNAILSQRQAIPAFLELLATVHLRQVREQLLLHIEPDRAI